MRRLSSLLVLAVAVLAVALVPTNRRLPDASAASTATALPPLGPDPANLAWLDTADALQAAIGAPLTRAALLTRRAQLMREGDLHGVARINALFAAEAQTRSRYVLDRWLGRFDPGTGLLPTSTAPDGQLWAYGDTGSDLFPHLAIAAHLLAPREDRRFLRLLRAERQLGPAVPDDIRLPSREPLGLNDADRVFGVAEYAKDGLLPLMDRLGPEPWLGRLVEIADRVMDASATPTRRYGPIPADSTEVNGDMLQVYTRTYWATGDRTYLDAGTRIARTYLEDVFPKTQHLPPNRWNFVDGEPLDRRRFRLSDHGNEILSGLLEWHLAMTVRGDPGAATDRLSIRRMLDRLAEKGRSPDGLWMRVIEIPSGRVDQDGVTDNWGYVSQAFLIQALVESVAPEGDPAAGARYREVAARSLAGVSGYRGYAWQQGEMDGYADAIESAVYILHEIDDPAAADWIDDQIGLLYAFQDASGAVVERDLDGNFIRSAMLEAARLTGGVRLDPWSPDAMVGAAKDGRCLALWAGSGAGWRGRLIVDVPRHRLYGRMPYDYPRLNKWPEWFVAEPDTVYRVTDSSEPAVLAGGHELAAGLPLVLPPGASRTLRICQAETGA